MFLVSSDNQFGFKRGLSSSMHAIYTVKSVVNEYCDIFYGSPDPCARRGV